MTVVTVAGRQRAADYSRIGLLRRLVRCGGMPVRDRPAETLVAMGGRLIFAVVAVWGEGPWVQIPPPRPRCSRSEARFSHKESGLLIVCHQFVIRTDHHEVACRHPSWCCV